MDESQVDIALESDHDHLRSRLVRQSSIAYTAVSFEWDPSNQGQTFETDDNRFQIRKSLYQFLQLLMQLRKTEIGAGQLRLWIDAISIN